MATRLTHAVERETGIRSNRGRQLIIRLERGGGVIRFREARSPYWYTLSMRAAFEAAVRATAVDGGKPVKLKDLPTAVNPIEAQVANTTAVTQPQQPAPTSQTVPS